MVFLVKVKSSGKTGMVQGRSELVSLMANWTRSLCAPPLRHFVLEDKK